MPSFTVLKLRNFKGGLHFSRGKADNYDKSQTLLHSDTLKSAIFVSALALYGEEKINKAFLEDFKISSAYPFYHSPSKDEPYYFYPKPMVKLPFHIAHANNLSKSIKKIRYIEQSLFKEILSAKEEEIELEENNFFNGEFVSRASIKDTLKKDGCEDIFKSQSYQHVSISRDMSGDSNPYYVDRLYFHPNAGLFFLLDCENDVIRQRVYSALRLLADNGLGTDKNTGHGHFEFDPKKDVEEVSFLDFSDAKHHMNLSLYLPRDKAEISDIEQSDYALEKRGGFIASPQNSNHLTIRKRAVYMFTEGSIFPKKDKQGMIANLKPNTAKLPEDLKELHNIWRDGRAIFLPLKKRP